MPVQTIKKQIYYPDGAKVSVQTSSGGAWFDVGAINSAVNNILAWDASEVETANAGELDKQIRNMRIEGGFTLVNLENEAIEKLGGGVFTRNVTTATPTTTVEDQVIAANWTDTVDIPLVLIDAGVTLKASIVPTVTTVTAATSGVLAADDDYFLKADANSPSGFSIFLNTAGTATVATTEVVTIDYNSITPYASETLTAGTSTLVLSAYAMKIEHTDDTAAIDRGITLYSVDSESGGFAFNWKGANEEGIEEMPLTYTAKLDTTLTDGAQLLELYTRS